MKTERLDTFWLRPCVLNSLHVYLTTEAIVLRTRVTDEAMNLAGFRPTLPLIARTAIAASIVPATTSIQ